VIAVNRALDDSPELINKDPYGEGWLFRLRADESLEGLMDAAAYAKLEAAEE
jgi:glycine cleavage system H protein